MSMPTRYLEERTDPSSMVDSTLLGTAAGAAAILTMKISMLWTVLQAV
jgi:hypothetical protein